MIAQAIFAVLFTLGMMFGFFLYQSKGHAGWAAWMVLVYTSASVALLALSCVVFALAVLIFGGPLSQPPQ